jgi:serine/threonine protein kinase
MLVQMEDSAELQKLVARLIPGLTIKGVAARSGQRVVYFCDYAGFAENKEEVQIDLTEVPDASAEAVAAHAGDDPISNMFEEDVDDDALSSLKSIPKGKVVLKVSRGLNANATAYLEREIEVLTTLDSEYFPELYYAASHVEYPDTGEKLDSRYFITIEELIESKPLSQIMADYKNEDAVVDLLLKLCTALQELWAQSIVHRDLKPPNILVRPNGNVVIIDLGIVRNEGEAGRTLTLAPWGPCTPGYCSPEQAKNDKKNISHKSDQFCLGILAYELLTGSNPFIPEEDDSNDARFARVIEHEPDNLQKKFGTSADLSKIVHSLLGKEPYQRFRKYSTLIEELIKLQEQLKAGRS